MRSSRVGEMGAVAVSLAGRAGEHRGFDGGCRWSTLPKAVSTSRRRASMPRTASGSTALSAYGSVRKSSMRVFTPEICADTRPATTRPVPTMILMIGFASVLTELQRTTVRANRASLGPRASAPRRRRGRTPVVPRSRNAGWADELQLLVDHAAAGRSGRLRGTERKTVKVRLPAVLPAVSRTVSRFLTRCDLFWIAVSPINPGNWGFSAKMRSVPEAGRLRAVSLPGGAVPVADVPGGV